MSSFLQIKNFERLELNVGDAIVKIQKSYYKPMFGEVILQNIFVMLRDRNDHKNFDVSSYVQQTGDLLNIDLSQVPISEITLYVFSDVNYEKFDINTTGEVYILDGIKVSEVSISPERKIVIFLKKFGIDLSKKLKRKIRLKW